MRDLRRLRTLVLHHNPLQGFPAVVCSLPLLTKLHVSFALAPGRDSLVIPTEVGNLTSLRILNAESDGIAELPDEIANLSKLRELRLENNRIPMVCLIFPRILRHQS